MFEAFLPLLTLFAIYAAIGALGKAARKTASAKKAAPRPAKVIPEAAPDPLPDPKPAPGPAPQADRLRPSVRVTEHDDSIYQGSMNAVTGEGYDPCHEEQLAPLTQAEAFEPAPAAVPGLQLNWTGDEIVRGIVISEVLKRKSL